MPFERDLLLGLAGDGDAARNMSRSAASSLRELLNGLFRILAERATSGDGVRGILGGEERKGLELVWNECNGKSESSSSECDKEIVSSGSVASVTKDSSGPFVVKVPECPRKIGDDSGSL